MVMGTAHSVQTAITVGALSALRTSQFINDYSIVWLHERSRAFTQ